MQPFVRMATLALVISVGGALRVVACEYDVTDGPVVTTEPVVVACANPNGCATNEPVATIPQAVPQPCWGSTCARPEPKLETVLKELDDAAVRAVKNADDPMKAFACATSPNCATPEPTVSTSPK